MNVDEAKEIGIIKIGQLLFLYFMFMPKNYKNMVPDFFADIKKIL